MAKLRYEINLLNGTLLSAASSTERITFTPSQYTGSIVVYLEAVASVSSGSANLTMTDGTINVLLTFSSPTVTLSRVLTSGLTAGPYTFWLVAGTNMTVKAARLVILHDSGGANPMRCETQIEIGSQSSVTAATIPTGTSVTNQQNPKYWFYDSTKWDGSPVFFFEAVFVTPTSKSACTIQLQVADGTGDGFAGWANVTNGTLTTTNQAGSQVPIRSSSFAPVSGRRYRVVSSTPTSKSAMNVYCAKIIVQQGAAATNQITLGGIVGGNIDLKGVSTSSGSNDLAAQSFTPGASIIVTALGPIMYKVGTPTDDLIISITGSQGGSALTSGRIAAANITSGTQFFVGVPAVVLSASTTYYFQIQRAGAFDGTNYWTVAGDNTNPYAGGMQSGHDGFTGVWTNFPSNDSAGTIRGYLATTTGITKLQPQYLIQNTLAATGTALQKQLINWDSTEWSGVSNAYTFEVNAADNSTSAVQLRTADDATLIATVTSPDNAGAGVATMPASTNLDVKATTNNNDLFAARLIATMTVSAPVAPGQLPPPVQTRQAVKRSSFY